jgi:hypothetical protein
LGITILAMVSGRAASLLAGGGGPLS